MLFSTLFQMDQEFKNVKRSVNETIGTLNKVNSSLQGFKSQVHKNYTSIHSVLSHFVNVNSLKACQRKRKEGREILLFLFVNLSF